jgi:TrmH family RNA methyltransferase
MISSAHNALLKQIRALRRSKERASTGLFLVEGIHHVAEAIQAGWPIEAIVVAPDQLRSAFGVELVRGYRGRIEEVPAQLLRSVAEKENPQGIIAVARKRFARLEDLGSMGNGVALVSPQDPGNLGSVMRTVDAVGGGALLVLDKSVDPFHPTAVRASMGAIFWIPVVQAGFVQFVDWARQAACQLIGTSAHAPSDYRTVRPRQPWILVLGSEQKGLAPPQLQACDTVVSIPMRGRTSSLNVAAAAAVLLYALRTAD